MISLIVFILGSLSFADYYVGANTAPIQADCSIQELPCNSLITALNLASGHSEDNPTIFLNADHSLTEPIFFNSDITLDGTTSSTLSLKTPSVSYLPYANYSLYVNATVAIQSLTLDISLFSDILRSFPIIVVGSSCSLSMFQVYVTGPDDDDYTTNKPIIDSTAGTLTLEAVTFRNFLLFDAPLLNISTATGAFTMKSSAQQCEYAQSDDYPLEYSPCIFSDIKRLGGNGTVFSLTLDDSADISLTNASFSSCTLKHNGSRNGFGGAIFIDAVSSSAQYTLEYLSFYSNSAPTNGHNIYIRMTSAPSATTKTMFISILEYNRADYHTYIDNYYVYESNNTSPATVQNFYELHDAVFIGQQYYHSSTVSGTYYHPYGSLNSSVTSPYAYILGNENFTLLTSSFTVSQSSLTIRPVGISATPTLRLSSISGTSAFITVPSSNSLTCCTLSFLVTFSQSDVSVVYISNILFSVVGTLNLTSVTLKPNYSYSDYLLKDYVIDASSSTSLILSSTTFMNFYLESKPLLSLNPAGALSTSGVSFESISRLTGDGAIISQTISSSSHTLSLNGMSFSSVSCSTGNGGAIYLTITAGTVNIGTTEDVSFSGCYTTGSSSGYTDGGGSIYIDITSGTLHLGGTDTVPSSSSLCSSTSIPSLTIEDGSTSGYGNNLYLKLSGTSPTITFGNIEFSDRYSSQGGYLYVYTTLAAWLSLSTWEALLESRSDFESSQYYLTYYNASSSTPTSSSIYSLSSSTSLTMTDTYYDSAVDTYGCYSDYPEVCPSLTSVNAKLQRDTSISTARRVTVSVDYSSSFSAATSALTFTRVPDLLLKSSPSDGSRPTIDIQTIGSVGTSLITVGATSTAVSFIVQSIDFNKVDTLSTGSSYSPLNNTLFKVLGGSSLTLSNVILYGYSDSWYDYLIDASNGILKLTDGTSIRSWSMSSSDYTKPLLNVVPANFELDGCIFESNSRDTSGACILNTTLSAGDTLNLTDTTFRSCSSSGTSILHFVVPTDATFNLNNVNFYSCSCSNANGGAIDFTVTGGTVNVNYAYFGNCYSSSKGGALAFTITGGAVNVGPETQYEYSDGDTVTPSVTFSSCYVKSNSSSTLVEGGAISVTISDGTFCLGGAAPTVTSPNPSYASTSFYSCHTTGNGNGGAVSLDITGGTVNIGVDSTVGFTQCYASHNTTTNTSTDGTARRYEQTGGMGGALCISLNKGTLQLGGIYTYHYPYAEQDSNSESYKCRDGCEYRTGNGRLQFTDCSTTSYNGLANSGGYGGAYYLHLLDNTSTLMFGKQSFTRSTDQYITGQGTFVYFSTNISDYILTPGRFADLLQYSSNWYKLDAFLAFDESTKTRYQMYAIGNTTLSVSGSSSQEWYCGVVNPCPTVELALLNWDRFAITPESIRIPYSATLSQSSIITRDVLVEGVSESDRSYLSVSSSIIESKHYGVFYICANATFQHLCFNFTDSNSNYLSFYSAFFYTGSNGTLILNNTLFCSDFSTDSSSYIRGCLINSQLGSLVLNNTMIANIHTYSSLLLPSPVAANFTLNNTVKIISSYSHLSGVSLLSYTLNESSHNVNVHDLVISGLDRKHEYTSSLYGQRAISASVSDGTFMLAACTFENCYAEQQNGIVNVYMTGGSTNIRQCTFFNCTTKCSSGGAIFLKLLSGSLSVISCTFTNCGAQYYSSDSYTWYPNGGAIFVNMTNGSLTFSSDTFLNCTAAGNGGAVFLTMYKGSLTIGKGVSITNCSAGFTKRILSAAHANGNTSNAASTASVEAYLSKSGHGGGIFMKIAAQDPEDIELDFEKIDYKNNTADDEGDTIFVITNNDEILADSAWNKLIPKEKDTEEGQFEYAVAPVNTTLSPTDAYYQTQSLPSKVHPGLSAGTIAGIVIGCVLFFIIVVVLVYCLLKNRNNSSGSSSGRSVSVDVENTDEAQKNEPAQDSSMTTTSGEQSGGDVPMEGMSS